MKRLGALWREWFWVPFFMGTIVFGALWVAELEKPHVDTYHCGRH